jgi:hypothetical protein
MNVLKKKYDAPALKRKLMASICEAQFALGRKTVDLRDARRLLAYIRNIKELLLNVHSIQNSSHCPDLPGMLEQLQCRYFELTEMLAQGNARSCVNKPVSYSDKKSA